MTVPTDASDPWFESVAHDVPLQQGDLIQDCPLLAWTDGPLILRSGGEVETLRSASVAIRADVIVMTQACDLAQNKVQNVILCPTFPIDAYKQDWQSSQQSRGQNPTERAWKSFCNDIRDGYAWNLSMLNAPNAEPPDTGIRIVDFHDVFSTPRSFLESLLQQRGRTRLCLRPPYREHLSQAFARYFMRVGLPVSITPAW